MAVEKAKVYSGPVEGLEAWLNELPDGWVPAVWHFYELEGGACCNVVAGRQVAQSIAQPIAMPRSLRN